MVRAGARNFTSVYCARPECCDIESRYKSRDVQSSVWPETPNPRTGNVQAGGGGKLVRCVAPSRGKAGSLIRKHDHFTPAREMRRDVRALTARDHQTPETGDVQAGGSDKLVRAGAMAPKRLGRSSGC